MKDRKYTYYGVHLNGLSSYICKLQIDTQLKGDGSEYWCGYLVFSDFKEAKQANLKHLQNKVDSYEAEIVKTENLNKSDIF